MLELKDIWKNYLVGDGKVEALKGVSLQFRHREFVSILASLPVVERPRCST